MKKVVENGTFSSIHVEVPTIEEVKGEALEIKDSLLKSATAAETVAAVRKYFQLSDTYSTISGIIYIHFTQDTANKEYAQAQDQIDELGPLFTAIFDDLENAILESPHLQSIKETFGDLFIKQLQNSHEIFSPTIIADLQQENKLVSEYSKVKSSAQIAYQGKTYNIPQMLAFTTSSDRAVRESSSKAVWNFFSEHDDDFGGIYDKLVKVRNNLAHKLGFKNFIEVAYKRMQRLDYGPEEIEIYRRELLKSLVPLSEKYRQKQMERIGIADPHYYDYSVNYIDGNPVPNGNTQELIEAAEKLYHKMSPEIGKYFTYLKEHDHLDLEARRGKQGGGYEAPLPDIDAPFIFSNFNKTQGDVEVLTHEFGHALQAFLGAHYEVPAYRSPGMECCEMHSMSMEYLAYPYIDAFFDEKNTRKYRFQHIIDALFFIPYGACVDEFQHVAYAQPDLTPDARKAEWRKIEKKYLPHIKYGIDCPFLEEGGFWYKQAHIYENPFYYIDYTIAQVVSLEFLVESEEDYDQALAKYLSFSRLGGTLPYRRLLEAGHIADPMKPGVISSLMKKVEKAIEKYEKEL